jgi:deazaflavin-dependent oxidoreductase (nitroreductase family)
MSIDRMTWEDGLIADMRANGGAVTTGMFAGRPLLVLMMRGARTGEPRRAVLVYSRDGDAYVVAGSKGGAPADPFWIANVRAQPDVTVEVGARQVPMRATIVEGAERDRLWAAHVAEHPGFADYEQKTSRVIPVVRLEARASG